MEGIIPTQGRNECEPNTMDPHSTHPTNENLSLNIAQINNPHPHLWDPLAQLHSKGGEVPIVRINIVVARSDTFSETALCMEAAERRVSTLRGGMGLGTYTFTWLSGCTCVQLLV